jgi:dihydropteroate synthase
MAIFIVKNKQEVPMWSMNSGGRILMAERPLVMGILNATPDSFHSESRVEDREALLALASEMLAEGADILDFGGQSTRPGSRRLDAAEESARVVPAIEAVRSAHPDAWISVDTYHALVAREAVAAGADIVNDISAGVLDADMIPTVASLRVPYIAMHMRGEPTTMQVDPQYDDVVSDVLDHLAAKRMECLSAGIHDLIFDPGFGFGKTVDHNFSLLNNLEALQILGHPLLVGLSRKSMITRTLGIKSEEALNGTTALNMVALMNGASILRVHDVKEAVEVVRLFHAIGKK